MVEVAEIACPPSSRSADNKSVMGRGLMLLEALSRAGGPLSLAGLAKATRLPKSTVHRMARQLVDLGLLDPTPEGFGMGLRIFEWGSYAERQRHIRRAAVPYLSELHTRVGETVHLGVLDSGDVIYVEKMEGRAAVPCPTYVGDRRPAHATALGKAMLAFTPGAARTVCLGPLQGHGPRAVTAPGRLYRQLQTVRETRVSLECEEMFPGVACVAAPILDAAGYALGAISITTPLHRFNPRRLAPVARDAADKISWKLAQHGHS